MNIKPILTIIAAGVIAFLVLLYSVALYQGRTSMDPVLQTALIGLIVTITSGISVYAQVRQGTLNRQNSDANAKATREKVQEGLDTMNDGLQTQIAGKVDASVAKTAEGVAERLRIREQEEALHSLTAKIDMLLQHQAAAVPVPTAPDPTAAAIEKNTAETASMVAVVATNTAVQNGPAVSP